MSGFDIHAVTTYFFTSPFLSDIVTSHRASNAICSTDDIRNGAVSTTRTREVVATTGIAAGAGVLINSRAYEAVWISARLTDSRDSVRVESLRRARSDARSAMEEVASLAGSASDSIVADLTVRHAG